MIGICERRSVIQACAEFSRTRRHLAGWKTRDGLTFDRDGYRIEFTDGRWTLFRNALSCRHAVYVSSYLIAVVDAAKEIK